MVTREWAQLHLSKDFLLMEPVKQSNWEFWLDWQSTLMHTVLSLQWIVQWKCIVNRLCDGQQWHMISLHQWSDCNSLFYCSYVTLSCSLRTLWPPTFLDIFTVYKYTNISFSASKAKTVWKRINPLKWIAFVVRKLIGLEFAEWAFWLCALLNYFDIEYLFWPYLESWLILFWKQPAMYLRQKCALLF